MSNPNSTVTLRSSPKRKRSRVNEPLDVGSLTPYGFTSTTRKNFIAKLNPTKFQIKGKLSREHDRFKPFL